MSSEQAETRIPHNLSATPDEAPGSGGAQLLILHYHLFKNAGTSVDEMLRRNFQGRWEEREFSNPSMRSNVAEVEAYLSARPELLAFSSHTATLPTPRLGGRHVFPIFFLRHPVARLKSAYSFERTQVADTHGARLAKAHDFAGYVRALLGNPAGRQAHNFQSFRLAFGRPREDGDELGRAMATLSTLPFCGLVEAYGQSLAKLETLLSPHIPGFDAIVVKKNVTEVESHGLEEKLDRIAKEIGPELNEALWKANADDLKLFDIVRRRYET